MFPVKIALDEDSDIKSICIYGAQWQAGEVHANSFSLRAQRSGA